MRLFLITLLLLPVLTLFNTQRMTVAENQQAQSGSQPEAERLWELAIAAKGGRERLRAVRNLVVTSRATYRLSMFRRGQLHYEEFYVFPSKMWAWYDDRPSRFGLYIRMYNLDRNLFYLASLSDPESPRRSERMPDHEWAIVQPQLLYLMETEWARPVPISATRSRIGRQPANIVQTRINDRRVDFALHPTSHLPLNVSIYFSQTESQVATRSSALPAVNVPLHSVALSDYVEVNGVWMPQTVNFDRTLNMQTTYQFNVEYDERIFERPPRIEDGPDGWRPQSSGRVRQ